jgi:hypothetical protein
MSHPRRIECFLIESTNDHWVYLRRYRSTYPEAGQCPRAPGAYHNAEALISEIQAEMPVSGDLGVPHDDPRWPLKCDHCAYIFQPEDQWQVNHRRKYVHQATGRTYALTGPENCNTDKSIDAPVGALWRADWLEDLDWRGPDGKSYIVRTPGGDWTIDGPSTTGGGVRQSKESGGGWTRSGEAPHFTVRPSILIGKQPNGSYTYHGFMNAGFLDEC